MSKIEQKVIKEVVYAAAEGSSLMATATPVVSSGAPLEGIIHVTGSPDRVAKLTWLLLRVAKYFHVHVELGSKSFDDWPIFHQDRHAGPEAPLALNQPAVNGQQIET